LSEGLSRSIAVIASSTVVPIVGCGALALRYDQRGLLRHPEGCFRLGIRPGLPGRRPRLRCASSPACFASNASEMYLRNIQAEHDMLVLGGILLLRSASAACHSFASKPSVAPLSRTRAPRLLIGCGNVLPLLFRFLYGASVVR